MSDIHSGVVEFLTARIDEDEEGASLSPREWWSTRLLAECEAKRRIVERHSQIETAVYEDMGGQDLVTYCGHCGTELDEGDCPDLLDLASVYSNHPAFDKDCWTPA